MKWWIPNTGWSSMETVVNKTITVYWMFLFTCCSYYAMNSSRADTLYSFLYESQLPNAAYIYHQACTWVYWINDWTADAIKHNNKVVLEIVLESFLYTVLRVIGDKWGQPSKLNSSPTTFCYNIIFLFLKNLKYMPLLIQKSKWINVFMLFPQCVARVEI